MSASKPAISFAIRCTQALFSIVVFGLACTLIKGHHLGSLPSTLSFTAFVGGLSFIGALLGITSYWITILRSHLGLLIDSAIAGVNLAGGLLMAIKLKGVQCKNESYRDDWEDLYANARKMLTSDIICGGVGKEGKIPVCWATSQDRPGSTMVSRCRMAQADSVFMFFTAMLVVGAAWLGWMRIKRGY